MWVAWEMKDGKKKTNKIEQRKRKRNLSRSRTQEAATLQDTIVPLSHVSATTHMTHCITYMHLIHKSLVLQHIQCWRGALPKHARNKWADPNTRVTYMMETRKWEMGNYILIQTFLNVATMSLKIPSKFSTFPGWKLSGTCRWWASLKIAGVCTIRCLVWDLALTTVWRLSS